MIDRSIVEAAARLRREREPHLIATVVRVCGSAYRRPGARMLLTQFRWIAGSVSGGCLEGDIAHKGWWRTQSGDPVVVSYDARLPDVADDDDVRAAFGLGCDGVVEVLLERAGQDGRLDVLELAHDCARAQQRAAVVTVIRSDAPGVEVGARLALRASGELGGDAFPEPLRAAMIEDARRAIEHGTSLDRSYGEGEVEACVEAIVPPPQLFVLGTGHDAVPVVELARQIGWEVTVCANRPRMSTRRRFGRADRVVELSPGDLAARIDAADRAVAIVMSHNYETDRQHLGLLVGTRARYIGVLGPRSRSERMLGELCLGLDDPRLHAPVGLELGAETPAEIALAMVAEIQAALTRAGGSSLRDRVGPIHERVEPTCSAAG
ncbi:MAG TPA: XdhC family protein [Kofleriaceae bacterium]|nr:XdhC family protein [Kofleriaceae bacterium]